MITLAFAEFALILAVQWTPPHRGRGRSLAEAPGVFAVSWAGGQFLGVPLSARSVTYYAVLAACLALFLVMSRFVHSPLGRTLQAIRDNELRAEALGYRTFVFQLAASSFGQRGRDGGSAGSTRSGCAVRRTPSPRLGVPIMLDVPADGDHRRPRHAVRRDRLAPPFSSPPGPFFPISARSAPPSRPAPRSFSGSRTGGSSTSGSCSSWWCSSSRRACSAPCGRLGRDRPASRRGHRSGREERPDAAAPRGGPACAGLSIAGRAPSAPPDRSGRRTPGTRRGARRPGRRIPVAEVGERALHRPRRDEQEIHREDHDRVAQRAQAREGQQRRPAARGVVEEQWPVQPPRQSLDLRLRGGRLDERDVGAGAGRRLRPADRVVEARDARWRPVRAMTSRSGSVRRLDGRPDAPDELLRRHDLLARQVPQRFGATWSSMWSAATPAASYCCTVRRTCSALP